MITALPEGLRGAVEKVAEECGVWESDAKDIILAFLNAALDAGVAREEIIKQSQFYDAKHEIRISLK